MAPKRKAPNTQAPKRARTTQGPSRQVRQGIGANQTEDDLPLSQRPSISSSSPSTRLPTSHDVPALTTLCARVFVANMAALYDEQKWPRMERYLSLLPDLMIPNLFSMLRAKWPTRLHHALITTVRPSYTAKRLVVYNGRSIFFVDLRLRSPASSMASTNTPSALWLGTARPSGSWSLVDSTNSQTSFLLLSFLHFRLFES